MKSTLYVFDSYVKARAAFDEGRAVEQVRLYFHPGKAEGFMVVEVGEHEFAYAVIRGSEDFYRFFGFLWDDIVWDEYSYFSDYTKKYIESHCKAGEGNEPLGS